MKTQQRLIFIVTVLFVMSACNLPTPGAPGTPDAHTATETSEPAAATATDTAAPAETATADGPPTAAPVTPTALSGDLLPALPAGDVVISTIDMITPLQGWAIGGTADPGDRVLTTTDGGSTWHEVTPPQPGLAAGSLPSAAFIDTDTAFVIYGSADRFTVPDDPPVWFTEDAGASWTMVGAIDNSGLADETWNPQFLTFFDATHGWFLVNVGAGMSHSYVALFGTTDGGHTWDRLVDPFSDTDIQVCQKTDLEFGNEGLGLLTFDCGGVVPAVTIGVTEDGGHTWEVKELFTDEFTAAGFPVADGAYCATDSINFIPGNLTLVGLLRASCKRFDGGTLTEQDFIIKLDPGAEHDSLLDYPGGRLQASLNDDSIFAFGPDIYQADHDALDFSLISSVIWEGQFDVVNADTIFAVARNAGDTALVAWDGTSWSIVETVLE